MYGRLILSDCTTAHEKYEWLEGLVIAVSSMTKAEKHIST
jgi:hypothetical protein